MEQYKQEFIDFMVESDVLKFGDFTLKSGRKSPFFMNAGAYVTGTQLARLGEYYAKAIHETYGDKINICTVVGFPLGYSVTEAKVLETRKAIEDGANEIDMVINISDVKNGDLEKVTKEIAALKEACGDKILKVIIETCYLTEEEKIAMCKSVTEAGADYIKTSTGFGTAGATIEDIRLFKKYIGPNVKMKAAGGVKTVADLEMFINEGCDRIGTSSAVNMLKGEEVTGY